MWFCWRYAIKIYLLLVLQLKSLCSKASLVYASNICRGKFRLKLTVRGIYDRSPAGTCPIITQMNCPLGRCPENNCHNPKQTPRLKKFPIGDDRNFRF
jgi:hypothetical protein